MRTELPALGPQPVIVSLPEAEPDELFGACEVLCQEGFVTWSLPIDRLAELPGLRTQFGRRARVGVHGVADSDQVRQAAQALAAFAASVTFAPELVSAQPDFPVILGGLTPTELQAGLAAEAAAVQVLPAAAFGADYAKALPRLLGYPELIASGELDARLAQTWLRAGAIAVWPSELLSTDLLFGTSLDALRAHLQEWRFHS